MKLWSITDRKYCSRDNISYLDKQHGSLFWRGVLLAAQAIKFGHRWVPGNGEKVHFWEDNWFRTAPLAVQFWKLYSICNEKPKTIVKICMNGKLRFNF
jgi:hypothetical protein